jgi:hypothetical protein
VDEGIFVLLTERRCAMYEDSRSNYEVRPCLLARRLDESNASSRNPGNE